MKNIIRRILRSRFTQSEEGSAMILIGLASLTLMATAGIAIDMGRVQTVQSRLSTALDAAGLAAGSMVNSGDVNGIVQKYFFANYPLGYMGSSIQNPTVIVSQDNHVLDLSVEGTVPTTFMRVFGITEIAVAAESQVTRANMGMELVLVIDVTGSMASSAGGGISRIQAAKNASTTLVNILFGDQPTAENLWVGLVPFAQSVNIGTSRAGWTSNPSMPSPGWGPTSWMGCVQAREAGGRDVTDDPPSVALFPKYYWQCHTSYNDWYGTNGDRDNCNTGSKLKYKSPLNTSQGPNKYCSEPVTPLTAYKNTILNGINAMQPEGNTHIVLGASWGWRMLSPRWRHMWGGEMDSNDLPLDYGTPLMHKVMILMTDGDNTITNSVWGAYGYLSDGRLGTTSSYYAVQELNSRLAEVCTSMKNNGIIIYTIAFGTGISGTVQNLLRNCASTPEYYFNSPSGAALQSAFQQIGDSLANLRVSQ